jgi:hypothetical protein
MNTLQKLSIAFQVYAFILEQSLISIASSYNWSINSQMSLRGENADTLRKRLIDRADLSGVSLLINEFII